MNRLPAPERVKDYVHEHPSVARFLSMSASIACLTGLGLVVTGEIQNATRQQLTYQRTDTATGGHFRFWQSQAERAMSDEDPSTFVDFNPSSPQDSPTYEVIYTFDGGYRVRFRGEGRPVTTQEALRNATSATTNLTP